MAVGQAAILRRELGTPVNPRLGIAEPSPGLPAPTASRATGRRGGDSTAARPRQLSASTALVRDGLVAGANRAAASSAAAASLDGERARHEAVEERVRALRARPELGVELAGDEPGVVACSSTISTRRPSGDCPESSIPAASSIGR